MLDSLEIKNFRSLGNFQVKKLGRINLIVGKNNSGKSSVLEALRIYAGNASRGLLEEIAQGHDETYFLKDNDIEWGNSLLPFEDLFTGRTFPDNNREINIGELDGGEKSLKIRSVWLVEKERIIIDDHGNKAIGIARTTVDKLSSSDKDRITGQALKILKDKESFNINFDGVLDISSLSHKMLEIPCSFIPTQFVSMNDLAKEWDLIVLTEAEEVVKEAMKIILPEFENLTFVNTLSSSVDYEFSRLAKVKIKGLSRPVSLNSLGDGMLRILQLVLKIFPAKGGFLLIDEFENGLHYSVQKKVWNLLFELAEKLDIQVFATTHSWDCIESFAKVAVEKQEIDGVLFRVGQSVRNSDKGRVIATVFDEEQLYSVTQSDVEVR